MEDVKKLLDVVGDRLTSAALRDAVASKPLSAGEQHVIVLSEVSVGFGAGGGSGEVRDGGPAHGSGSGGGGGGGAKVKPVAVLVVDQGKVRLEALGG